MTGTRQFTTSESAFAGITVTLTNTDTQELEVTTRGGHYIETSRWYQRTRDINGPRELLRALVAELDQRPGTWKIQTISTPNTIFADIRGRRQGGPDHVTPVAMPETQLLAQIGRIDMWAGRQRQHTLERRKDTRVDRQP